MMLARWLDRRRRPAAWWSSLELRAKPIKAVLPTEGSEVDVADDSLNEQYAEQYQGKCVNGAATTVRDVDETLDACPESGNHKEALGIKPRMPSAIGFRAPTKVKFPPPPVAATEPPSNDEFSHQRVTSPPASLNRVIPQKLAYERPVLLQEIYTWTDKDITDFSHDKERIEDVRGAILELSDRLNITKVSSEIKSEVDARPEFGKCMRDDWHVACIAHHVCELNSTAALLAEEVAMHGAANALIARPSLRVNVDKSVPKSSKSVSQTKSVGGAASQLREQIRSAQKAISRLVEDYGRDQSVEWRKRLLSVGRTSLQLLQITQGASEEMATGNN